MKNIVLSYISHFKRFYGTVFQPVAEKQGLTQLEVDILLFLYNNPEYNTARDIAEIRGFAKSNVSNAVESLRRKGYLASEPDPDSRKVRRLKLSVEKADIIQSLADCQERCFSTMMEGFAPEERRQLWDFLARTDQNIQKALAKAEERKREV